MSGKTSGSDAKGRDHHDGSAGRAFTVEQKAAVIRIKQCAPTAYYKILGLEEVKATCSDSDIKKAYRKLSLLTHPDKNGYDGADDAFKLVSKAFQVLSDPDKKKKYDQFGLDPDARFDPRAAAGANGGGGGPSPFGNGFARRGGGGFGDEEMTPEELFRQFFGGAFGGPFAGPSLVFETPRTPNTMKRVSSRIKIDYFVDPKDVQDYTPKKWRKLDEAAENQYVSITNTRCQTEKFKQRKAMEDAQGWFSVDTEAMNKARNMELKNCNKLRKLGLEVYGQ
ncbi:DnaJ DnaJ-class molecular chaperone with C-terminal Zn finger domain protein [Pyrenophora tritici-repentis]|nr:DnaJ DnaJ-class molecular chaperone with C-terminal Zn finger domain protein [Pyrenophora tritici-repentis]KAI0607554.1 DnaJ DnaJ-class molecular chaperone with C-terminal Zn finger domain protein [Pyrenophora tritici-repentis]KAI0619694.1 DnaJ DnaJ-class molecular chaperone with C-terminal Zn finger domain protein [Pyrenophora tritici-repentis]KAI1540242.1 DnaJ DnaJ-class molecular chaperone with C-terminal Zn finger domain [Pyrenophora tritici-repentis]KAI1581633.1 DnaJ DnaJ-class molecula